MNKFVVVETMPEHLRESHAAAHNKGVWPHNGAKRYVMLQTEAEELLSEDPEWSSIEEGEPIHLYINRTSVDEWEVHDFYVQTYGERDACNVEVRIGEARIEGEPTGVFFISTFDDAGGGVEYDETPYPSYEEAEEAADAIVSNNNEADPGQDAEDYLDSLDEKEAEEDPEGTWCCYWNTALEDSHVETRHSTIEAAQAAVRLRNKALKQHNPGELLCGYEIRELLNGEWVSYED